MSVIVPCYKQAHFLAEALDSLLRQTYQNIEAIVVDDGSPDDTARVASAFGSFVKYIRQEHRGLPAARNAGVAASTGEYFQFLDADDLIERDKLALQAAYLRDNAAVDIVYGDARYFAGRDPADRFYDLFRRRTEPWIPSIWQAPGDALSKLAAQNLFPVSCALVRRRTLTLVGPWNEELSALEDWEYWIRCAVAGMCFQYESWQNTFALIRVHAASMSQNVERMAKATYQLRIVAGSVVHEREFRLRNFAKGVEEIRRPVNGTLPVGWRVRLVRLAYANATWRVWLRAFFVLTAGHPVLEKLLFLLASAGRRLRWRVFNR